MQNKAGYFSLELASKVFFFHQNPCKQFIAAALAIKQKNMAECGL